MALVPKWSLPLAVAAVTHAAVDAVCALTLFGALAAGRISAAGVLPAFLGYGILAFGTQPLLGFVADRGRSYVRIAVAGALVVVLGSLVSLLPYGLVSTVALLGIGNAAFHVGAGAFSLLATPGKATAPALFVAPGAAGLALGTAFGKAGASPLIAATLLVVLALVLAPALRRYPLGVPRPRAATRPAGALEQMLPLVLAVVVVRSFVGGALVFPWRSGAWAPVALTAAIVLGKAGGGIAADRLGRTRTGVLTLLAAAPLLAAGPQWAAAGLLGLLAFNVTMPITLVALADALPEYPGTAFGLTCLALIAGAFPALVGLQPAALPVWLVPAAVIASAGLLGYGLARLEHNESVPLAYVAIAEGGD